MTLQRVLAYNQFLPGGKCQVDCIFIATVMSIATWSKKNQIFIILSLLRRGV